MERPKLIVFDLNKTLIQENSWQELNLAMGVTPKEDSMLLEQGRRGEISDQEAQRQLLALYRRRDDTSREHIMQILTNYTYIDGAKDTVLELQRRGYRLALISGSMDILVEHVAHDLGVDIFGANNQFVFDANDQLIDIRTIDNDTDYKVQQLKDLCVAQGITPTDCLCVGDGDNDVPIFELTGRGVTFENSAVQDKATYTINTLSKILDIVAVS